jgi:hypothetical protein
LSERIHSSCVHDHFVILHEATALVFACVKRKQSYPRTFWEESGMDIQEKIYEARHPGEPDWVPRRYSRSAPGVLIEKPGARPAYVVDIAARWRGMSLDTSDAKREAA